MERGAKCAKVSQGRGEEMTRNILEERAIALSDVEIG